MRRFIKIDMDLNFIDVVTYPSKLEVELNFTSHNMKLSPGLFFYLCMVYLRRLSVPLIILRVDNAKFN